jgi:hypothetical protein
LPKTFFPIMELSNERLCLEMKGRLFGHSVSTIPLRVSTTRIHVDGNVKASDDDVWCLRPAAIGEENGKFNRDHIVTFVISPVSSMDQQLPGS